MGEARQSPAIADVNFLVWAYLAFFALPEVYRSVRKEDYHNSKKQATLAYISPKLTPKSPTR